METLDHFRKLRDIIRQDGILDALKYDIIETARRNPKVTRRIADIYLYCISPNPINIQYGERSLKASPDYMGKLAILEGDRKA